MIIDKRPIGFNFSKRFSKKDFIVVHDTGNRRAGADALAHYRYFSSGDRRASAHFFVDEANIMELVECSLVAWHCGDGRGRFGISNDNSIGVEICVNSDGNFEMAQAQAIELIRFLMATYGIPKKNVVRHYDASRKVCPASMAGDDWALWWEFWGRI